MYRPQCRGQHGTKYYLVPFPERLTCVQRIMISGPDLYRTVSAPPPPHGHGNSQSLHSKKNVS